MTWGNVVIPWTRLVRVFFVYVRIVNTVIHTLSIPEQVYYIDNERERTKGTEMKLSDLCLNITDPYYLERHIVPSEDHIYCACIQDVMRDYADLADWLIAEYRTEPVEDIGYADRLKQALGVRIAEVFTGKRM